MMTLLLLLVIVFIFVVVLYNMFNIICCMFLWMRVRVVSTSFAATVL